MKPSKVSAVGNCCGGLVCVLERKQTFGFDPGVDFARFAWEFLVRGSGRWGAWLRANERTYLCLVGVGP